jgi:hypothetical protein
LHKNIKDINATVKISKKIKVLNIEKLKTFHQTPEKDNEETFEQLDFNQV